jgi:tetratricopeptide (TPR) repeat protein
MIIEIDKEKIENMQGEGKIRWDKRRGYLKRKPSTGELVSQRSHAYFFDLGRELNESHAIEAMESADLALDRVAGFEDIYKEIKKMETPGKAYVDFNFQMGVACREMGFIEEAIDEFKIALEKGEKPSESANHLSRCYRDKGWFQEATEAFQKALGFKNETNEDCLTTVIGEMELVEMS